MNEAVIARLRRIRIDGISRTHLAANGTSQRLNADWRTPAPMQATTGQFSSAATAFAVAAADCGF